MFLPLCDAGFKLGGFNLAVTQSDRALRAFIYVCGSEINEVTGAVATDGTITLSGQGAVQFYDPMTLSSFQATISGTAMTGIFACTLNLGGSATDTVTIKGTLKDVTLYSRDPNVPF